MTIWDLVMAEPKYLAIIGLGFDLVGGVLVAMTAWFRVQLSVAFGGPATESARELWWRRSAVVTGGFFLSTGFGLQIVATWLQIP